MGTPAPTRSISITRCYLAKPHVRLTIPGENRIPFKPADLTIADGSTSVSATLPFINPSVQVEVQFFMPPEEQIELRVEATLADGRFRGHCLFRGAVSGTYKDKSCTSVDLKFQAPFAVAIPWRYAGGITIFASYRVADENIVPAILKWGAGASLYFITHDMSPAFSGGIPKEFMDLFILDLDEAASPRMKWVYDWIEWAVTRCHDSLCHAKRYPDYHATNEYPAIHSYRYDVWGGNSHFVQPSGSQFDLDQWLLYRLDKQRLITINCYDQAYLVNLVLNLGLPYHLKPGMEDEKNPGRPLTTVGIFYKGAGFYVEKAMPGAARNRWGYLTESDLVGWGYSNNPFFRGVEEDMVVPWRNDHRTSFRNHKWVCIRELHQGSNEPYLVAVDACAGPAASPNYIVNYLERAIDLEACMVDMKERKSKKDWGKDWNILAYHILPPVKSTVSEVGLEGTDGLGVYYTQSVKPFFKKHRPDFDFEHSDAAMLTTGVVLDDLLSVVADTIGQLQPESGPFTPYQTVSGTVSMDRTVLYYKLDNADTRKDNSGPLLSITIDVLTSLGRAAQHLAVRIATSERDREDDYATLDGGYGDLSIKSADGLRVTLIYRNLVLSLSARPECKLAPLTESVAKFMANYKDVPLPATLGQDRVTVKAPKELPVGQDFEIRVTAPSQVKDIEVATGGLHDTNPKIDPCREGTSLGQTKLKSWTFTSHTRGTWDGEIYVYYPEPGTYFPTSFSVPFKVVKAAN